MIKFSRSTNYPGGKVMYELQLTYVLSQVLEQTTEQWNNLLKTSALIKIARRYELKACFARFIWASLQMQEAVTAEKWESNVRVGSIITPKPLTESVVKRSLPRNESLKLSGLQIICRLLKTMSFVFSASKGDSSQSRLHWYEWIECR